MIYSFIHPGSGLGNSLHRIVAGKVLALDKGLEYSAIGRENFKGKSFMDVDFGPSNDISYDTEMPAGKLVQREGWNMTPLWEEKTNYYNPEFNFIEDNTIIDGEFQDERYFEHRLKEIDEWLKIIPMEAEVREYGTDLCVIGFRGGEFYTVPELGLPQIYYEEGIVEMLKINPKMRFEVHTDDLDLAHKFFPNHEVIHDIGINWRSMRYAKYAIIANSSFYILPRLLKHHEAQGAITVGPRLWARRNLNNGVWSMPQNFYRSFHYI